MARFARLVVPGFPHHITQRGVRSMDIFSDSEDRIKYLSFLKEESARSGMDILAWCLMTNHVHFIAVPEKENSLARSVGEAHRRYTRYKNFQQKVRGYLFQGRFSSCVLDETHLLFAGRYVDRNPVAAGMVEKAFDYQWSSARYSCGLVDSDPLVSSRQIAEMVDDWSSFLETTDEGKDRLISRQTKTGRPLGCNEFVDKLESLTGRLLKLKKPGRPRSEGK